MRLDLSDQMLAEVIYSLESMRWLARVYESEDFAQGINDVLRELRVAVNSASGQEVNLNTIEPRLSSLAHRRHEAADTKRWVQLDDVHVRLLQNASHTITGAIDAPSDSTLISLGLAQIIQQWDDAPSVCPREASCSSKPSCPCEGGIPV